MERAGTGGSAWEGRGQRRLDVTTPQIHRILHISLSFLWTVRGSGLPPQEHVDPHAMYERTRFLGRTCLPPSQLVRSSLLQQAQDEHSPSICKRPGCSFVALPDWCWLAGRRPDGDAERQPAQPPRGELIECGSSRSTTDPPFAELCHEVLCVPSRRTRPLSQRRS